MYHQNSYEMDKMFKQAVINENWIITEKNLLRGTLGISIQRSYSIHPSLASIFSVKRLHECCNAAPSLCEYCFNSSSYWPHIRIPGLRSVSSSPSDSNLGCLEAPNSSVQNKSALSESQFWTKWRVGWYIVLLENILIFGRYIYYPRLRHILQSTHIRNTEYELNLLSACVGH